MNREANMLLGFALSVILAPLAFSQDGTPQPCPNVTAETLGCQLVAWSHLQEPVPLPEPDTKPAPPPDQPDQAQKSQTRPQASRQAITGIIVRRGEKYVLRAGDNTAYQLDDQNRVGHYQDKQVKIVGKLDVDSNTIHIESIEIIS